MSGLTPFWSVASIVSLLLISYLLGSIPGGYLAGKWIKGIDLRDYGSGTVSGSMVWEHVAKWAVVPVGLFDIFKGALATWLGLHFGLGEIVATSLGFAAIVGHNWPVYLNFHGGRGFSPFIGALLVIFPWGVPILFAGLVIGNLLRSPLVPLLVVMILPIFSIGSPNVLWLAAGMTVITVIKRVEANRRPLPENPSERRKVILRRILLDRDIQDQKLWIRREPNQHD